jgi:hypothetical protein
MEPFAVTSSRKFDAVTGRPACDLVSVISLAFDNKVGGRVAYENAHRNCHVSGARRSEGLSRSMRRGFQMPYNRGSWLVISNELMTGDCEGINQGRCVA